MFLLLHSNALICFFFFFLNVLLKSPHFSRHTYAHPGSETLPFLFSNQALSLLRWHFCVFVFPACDVRCMFAKPCTQHIRVQPRLHVSVSRARGAGKCLTGPCSLGLILHVPGRQWHTSYCVSLMKAFCMTCLKLYRRDVLITSVLRLHAARKGTRGVSANDKLAEAKPSLRELTTVNHDRG